MKILSEDLNTLWESYEFFSEFSFFNSELWDRNPEVRGREQGQLPSILTVTQC